MTEFRATGTCPNCHTFGRISIPSRAGSLGATYQVGNDVASDISLYQLEVTSFLVRPPTPGEPIHVLMAWSCDTCKFENFAEVVFADGRILDIQPVELTVGVLARVHFVSELVDYRLAEIIGHDMYDEQGVWPGWLPALREALDRGLQPSGEVSA